MDDEPLNHRNSKETERIMTLLLGLPIFKGLDPDRLKILAPHFHVMDLPAGDTLFLEGSTSSYVCFVVKGALDVLKRVDVGGDVVLTTLREGRSIGEMSIIDDFPRSATVKAQTDATLVILTKDSFDRIATERPDLGFEILKGLARLLSMNLRKTSARLADYMLPLS